MLDEAALVEEIERSSQPAKEDLHLELHMRVDRRFGIPREVGLRWFEAARYGDLKTIRALVESAEKQTAATNPNPNQNLLVTPLLRLLHYNGQATSYGFVGSIALHWAVANGDAAMAKYLLSKGSAVNCQNNGGSTLLHSACANGQTAMVQLLLSFGASPQIVDCCAQTPADVVPLERRKDILPLLSSALLSKQLAEVPSSSWSVQDMKTVVRLVLGQEATKINERGELVSTVERILNQAKQQIGKTLAADLFAKKLHERVLLDHARRAEAGELDEGEVTNAEARHSRTGITNKPPSSTRLLFASTP